MGMVVSQTVQESKVVGYVTEEVPQVKIPETSVQLDTIKMMQQIRPFV